MSALTHWYKVEVTDRDGNPVTVQLRGDMVAIARRLGYKAANNRTGKARALSGAIEVRVLKESKR